MQRGQAFEPAIVVDPTSLMSEAYRAMRTSLLALWARHPKNHRPFAGDEAERAVDGAVKQHQAWAGVGLEDRKARVARAVAAMPAEAAAM